MVLISGREQEEQSSEESKNHPCVFMVKYGVAGNLHRGSSKYDRASIFTMFPGFDGLSLPFALRVHLSSNP